LIITSPDSNFFTSYSICAFIERLKSNLEAIFAIVLFTCGRVVNFQIIIVNPIIFKKIKI
jgi:hypothetical protein